MSVRIVSDGPITPDNRERGDEIWTKTTQGGERRGGRKTKPRKDRVKTPDHRNGNISRLGKSVGMRLTERIMRANLLVRDS